MNAPPDLVLFFGRLHPLLVHLPIAFILLLTFLEALARVPKFKHANANAGIILALAVPCTLLAAGFGWLLALGGGYQEQLLAWHRWTGLAVAGVCVVAAMLYRLDLKRPYRWSLYIATAVLLFAAHFGGSLTHGSDYLVRYAPQPLRQWLGGGGSPAILTNSILPPNVQVYSALVQPVFEQNCISCHGPEKSKGGLRLDSLEAMLKGGDSGAAVVPGNPAATLLLKRVRLPLSHEDHMPPDGKPQPSPDDITLLEWWIQNGASVSRTMAELNKTPAVARILQARFGGGNPTTEKVEPKPLSEVMPVAARLGEELNIIIETISPDEPWLQCNAGVVGTNFGNAELTQLAAIGPNLRWLDLAGTAVRDEGLAVLERMPNLARLHLERTGITDAGLVHLGSLSQLDYLNLHHTGITDAGLQGLQPLQNLRQLYLWGTEVKPEAAQAFAESRTDKEQIENWRREIEELNARIRQAHVTVDVGAVAHVAEPPKEVPVNTECPVSGKPVDPSKTLVHDGRLIAFCCDDCRAKFEQNPKEYLAKLPAAAPEQTNTESPK